MPTVAALAGHVVGGALELALACGCRIAAANARLSLPEVKLGIVPGAGGTQRLPRVIGPAAALRMLLTGEAVDARHALELGLIDAVCPPEQWLEWAARYFQTPHDAPRSACANRQNQRSEPVREVAA